jgi:hypothetical protein
MPAQAGIYLRFCWKGKENLDSGRRRNDEKKSRPIAESILIERNHQNIICSICLSKNGFRPKVDWK